MLLWLKVRGAPALVLTGAAFILLTVAVGDWAVTIPTVLGGGSAAFGWLTFAPLACATAIAYSLDTRGTAAERRASQPLGALDAGLFLVFLGTLVACTAVVATEHGLTPGVWRNVAILCGTAATATCWMGASRGAMTATLLLLVTSSYSPHNRGAAYVRILQPDANERWAAVTALVAVTAALLSLLVADVLRRRHQFLDVVHQ